MKPIQQNPWQYESLRDWLFKTDSTFIEIYYAMATSRFRIAKKMIHRFYDSQNRKAIITNGKVSIADPGVRGELYELGAAEPSKIFDIKNNSFRPILGFDRDLLTKMNIPGLLEFNGSHTMSPGGTTKVFPPNYLNVSSGDYTVSFSPSNYQTDASKHDTPPTDKYYYLIKVEPDKLFEKEEPLYFRASLKKFFGPQKFDYPLLRKPTFSTWVDQISADEFNREQMTYVKSLRNDDGPLRPGFVVTTGGLPTQTQTAPQDAKKLHGSGNEPVTAPF